MKVVVVAVVAVDAVDAVVASPTAAPFENASSMSASTVLCCGSSEQPALRTTMPCSPARQRSDSKKLLVSNEDGKRSEV